MTVTVACLINARDDKAKSGGAVKQEVSEATEAGALEMEI